MFKRQPKQDRSNRFWAQLFPPLFIKSNPKGILTSEPDRFGQAPRNIILKPSSLLIFSRAGPNKAKDVNPMLKTIVFPRIALEHVP